MAAAMLSSAPRNIPRGPDGRSSARLPRAPMRLYMERIGVRIAVSEEARRTLIEHHGATPSTPKRGRDGPFRTAQRLEQWAATDERLR